jgi:hypothetical protein
MVRNQDWRQASLGHIEQAHAENRSGGTPTPAPEKALKAFFREHTGSLEDILVGYLFNIA